MKWTEEQLSGGGHYGGTLDDIPLPHIRRWPNENKEDPRPVTVRIMKFWGIGSHYYVSVDEHDNPIWNSKKKCFTQPWTDPGGKGRKFDCLQRPRSYYLAKRWAMMIIGKHFSDGNYRIDIEDNSGNEWYYGEGD